MTEQNKNSVLAPYEMARKLSILKKAKQVLIIDDQSTGRTILEKVIQQIGDNIHVTSMSNPTTALEWLDLHGVDLIVTDYRMPEINGIEFIRLVRQKTHCLNVPIVMITVVSEKAVRYEALEAGATITLDDTTVTATDPEGSWVGEQVWPAL